MYAQLGFKRTFSWAGFVYPQIHVIRLPCEFLIRQQVLCLGLLQAKNSTHNDRVFPLYDIQSKFQLVPVAFKSITFKEQCG